MEDKRNKTWLQGRGFLTKTAFGIAILSLVCFAGQSVFAQTKAPIKIGVAISLTGKWARTGELEVGGYKLWGKIINERGCSYGEVEKLGCSEPGLLG